MHFRNVLFVALVFAMAALAQAPDSAFQVRYAANLGTGESYINIVNTGANGAAPLGPGFGGAAGNTCVNVYAFSPDEQLVSCCSCLLTPNQVSSLAVVRDLQQKTLTGINPPTLVVKLVNTLAGTGSGTNCSQSAATASTVAGSPFQVVPGMVAWGTTLHQQGTGFATTETPFTPATLSVQELASITGRCASIIGNGSGFGICNSCKAGALGGAKK
jgi:hypothetical protein